MIIVVIILMAVFLTAAFLFTIEVRNAPFIEDDDI